MKKILFALFMLTSTSSIYALTLDNIVIGADLTDINIKPIYPCSSYQGVVGCGSPVILEKRCAETLKIKKNSLECISLSGDMITFGTFDEKAIYRDPTTSGDSGAWFVKYSSRVELKETRKPNGNYQYQVIVK